MISGLVFGASGQLGQTLKFISEERGYAGLRFLAEEEGDILDINNLEEIFTLYEPDFCINCAAYTNVDKAEDEPQVAKKINAEGVSNLSKLCRQHNTTMIHFSTDYIFGGKSNSPITEEDVPIPLGVYAASKWEGEQAIQKHMEKYFIIRTSWMYSPFGNNFLKTMLRLAKDRTEIKVIWDQIGTPTYALDLADCVLDIIEAENKEYGIYNFSNEGIASWYDFATAIFQYSSLPVKVFPIRSFEYVSKATRPSFSVLDKTKIKKFLDKEIPHWTESLHKCINQFKNNL